MYASEWSRRVALIAAHPDDEIIGAGAQLAKMRDVYVVHVTDGSPANLGDARRNGFQSAAEYASARRAELACALSLAGLDQKQTRQLKFADQQTSHKLVQLALAIEASVEELRPDVVITQPYEGGHPDHDATAFGVHMAVERLRGRRPELLEMTSYHELDGVFWRGQFLRNGPEPWVARLSPAESALKRRMLDCFATQRQILREFSTEEERFRPAPAYDFTMPPHEGTLHYDHFDWGIRSEQWRAFAAEAQRELGQHC